MGGPPGGSPSNSQVEEERPMIVDRDGGRSPGELPGEKAVGREDFQMRRLALAVFKAVENEGHVAHRRRPHEHATQTKINGQLEC